MIEGDKQKSIIDNGNRSVITDLGKGSMMMMDARHKTYAEFPFPPKGGSMAAMQGGVAPTISFKKTGGHDKIIGYPCDEYSGAGTVGGNPVGMLGCFSDSAPGATDYSNFQREMADKVKGTAMANMGQIPPGVPLKDQNRVKLGCSPLPPRASSIKRNHRSPELSRGMARRAALLALHPLDLADAPGQFYFGGHAVR